MTRTISIFEDGVSYQVTGEYCPGCGYSPARFETQCVVIAGYVGDARMVMNIGMVAHLQAEALAACVESDAKILGEEEGK